MATEMTTMEAKPRFGPTMNESTRSSTMKEDSLYAILSRLRVGYLAKEPVRIYGEFWPDGNTVVLLPDALIIDKRYHHGVIEVDGSSHKTRGSVKWDARKDAYYCKMWLWVARIANKDVNQKTVEAILREHARKVDAYGGTLP